MPEPFPPDHPPVAPHALPGAPSQSTEAGLEAIPERRPALLVCDDEEGPRESLRIIFKDDYEVLVAASGPQAIELAQQHRVDVAVCDIRMPGMSGIEVLERLKFVDPTIEVVMVTAFESSETLRQALRLRASDYINKPFEVAVVRAALARAMKRRRVEAEARDCMDKIQELSAEMQGHDLQEQIAQKRNEIYTSIIHDINGPLTVISGYAQLLSQRLTGGSKPEPEDYEYVKHRLAAIQRQTISCLEISQRYLSFLQRQGGDDRLRVSINQVLADLNQLVLGHPSLENNQFVIHPLERDIHVRVNGTDLIQILRNLAVNAFQASTVPHKVEVSGRVLAEPLDLAQLQNGPHDYVVNVETHHLAPPLLMLTVRDDGPGIPAEVLPKVFQPFFTTKSARQGTGLGLSIILRLVKQAGCVLHLHSVPGAGTSFTLYLPAMENPVESPP